MEIEQLTLVNVSLIAIAGVLPAILWLIFWIKEDRMHPEPKRLIALSFFLGMLGVPVTLVAQVELDKVIPAGVFLFAAWALIEEICKFTAAYVSTHLGRRYYDEPIDALIYLITAALGFAALENVLFLNTDLLTGGLIEGLKTGHIRFIGPSLLHVLTSAIIGVALAYVFYKPIRIRAIVIIFSIGIATGVHTLFNSFLSSTRYENIGLMVFSSVWVALIMLLVIFEKVKRLPRRGTSPQRW